MLNGFSESEKSQNNEGGEMIEYTVKVNDDGDRFWYINDKLHRERAPAIESANGTKHYYLNGKRHREDGAAIEYANGNKSWYLNGEPVAEEEHARRTSKIKELTVQEISDLLGYEVKVVK